MYKSLNFVSGYFKPFLFAVFFARYGGLVITISKHFGKSIRVSLTFTLYFLFLLILLVSEIS